MSAALIGLKLIIKQVAAKAFMKKVEREFVKIIDEGDHVTGTVGEIEEVVEIHKGKAVVWGVGIALLGFAASQGWIDASLAQALIDFASDESVQSTVNQAIESASD